MIRSTPISTFFPSRTLFLFFFNDTATTEIYTLSLHDALPISNTLLSISPKSGIVAPGSSVPITVTPNVLNSTAGVINATLAIQGTSVKSQQVAVKITISNQALISVSPVNIVCKLSSITTSSTQSLNITNSGSATLNWTFSQSLPAWISIDTPSGTLSPGFIAFVNVACNNTA